MLNLVALAAQYNQVVPSVLRAIMPFLVRFELFHVMHLKAFCCPAYLTFIIGAFQSFFTHYRPQEGGYFMNEVFMGAFIAAILTPTLW